MVEVRFQAPVCSDGDEAGALEVLAKGEGDFGCGSLSTERATARVRTVLLVLRHRSFSAHLYLHGAWQEQLRLLRQVLLVGAAVRVHANACP